MEKDEELQKVEALMKAGKPLATKLKGISDEEHDRQVESAIRFLKRLELGEYG